MTVGGADPGDFLARLARLPRRVWRGIGAAQPSVAARPWRAQAAEENHGRVQRPTTQTPKSGARAERGPWAQAPRAGLPGEPQPAADAECQVQGSEADP